MSASNVQTLYERVIGPFPNCRQLVWNRISDFQGWPGHLTELVRSDLSDPDCPGRGSKLQLSWTTEIEEMTITHWHPGQRVDLVTQTDSRRLGLRINLVSAADQEHIKLVVSMELAQKGLLRLLYPLQFRRNARRWRDRIEQLLNDVGGLSKS